MGETTEDGKIRLRCTGCGKRVKFPAEQGGGSFRCPLCHTLIVAPIAGADAAPPSSDELASVKTPPMAPTRHVIPQRTEPVKTFGESAAARPEPPRERAIVAITNFLVKETQRVAHLSQQILADARLSVEDQSARIMDLRRSKAVHFKHYVETVLKQMDDDIKELRESPASETQSVQDKLKALSFERRGVQMYVGVMFEYRTGGATGTPAGAKAPPSTPSPQAARTPPGTADAGPGPDGKGPNSSGSPQG